MIRIAALLVVAGCSPPGARYVGTSTLGQSTAAGPKDPSAPIAMVPDLPPPGPGLPISTPGRAPIPAGPGAFGGQTESPATIAPSGTIAPGGAVTPGRTDSSTPAAVVAPIGAQTPATTPGPATPAPTAPPPGAEPPNVGPGTGTGTPQPPPRPTTPPPPVAQPPSAGPGTGAAPARPAGPGTGPAPTNPGTGSPPRTQSGTR